MVIKHTRMNWQAAENELMLQFVFYGRWKKWNILLRSTETHGDREGFRGGLFLPGSMLLLSLPVKFYEAEEDKCILFFA